MKNAVGTTIAAGLCLMMLAALLAAPACRAATVKTLDGKTLDGTITFDSPDSIGIQTADGKTTVLPLTNLLSLATPTARVRAVQLPATLPSTPAASQPSASTTLPVEATNNSAWVSVDIGRCKFPGGAIISGEGDQRQITIGASGWGIWGPHDSFHFVGLPWNGTGQIVAHLISLDESKGSVVAGLCFRQNLADDSPHVTVEAISSGQVHEHQRPGSRAEWVMNPPDKPFPGVWLRLGRAGDNFVMYRSGDGKGWVEVARHPVGPLPPSGYFGLVVSTRVNAYTAAAKFDHVLVVETAPQATFYPNSSLPSAFVVLRDGTILAGTVTFAEQEKMYLAAPQTSKAPPAPTTLPTAEVAAIVFHPISDEALAQLSQPGPNGLVLQGGDIIEGDFKSIGNHQDLTISSVLVGIKTFQTTTDCLIARLNRVQAIDHGFAITTRDGSRYLTPTLNVENHALVVNEPATGKVLLGADNVADIQAR